MATPGGRDLLVVGGSRSGWGKLTGKVKELLRIGWRGCRRFLMNKFNSQLSKLIIVELGTSQAAYCEQSKHSDFSVHLLHIRAICLFVFFFKILLYTIAWNKSPTVPEGFFDVAKARIDYNSFHPAIRKLAIFDAGWYLDIVSNRYTNGKDSGAFYPLWPFLLKVFGCANNPWAPLISAVLSVVFWCLGLGLLFSWAAKEFSYHMAWCVVLVNLLLPSSMTFWLGFTESLFFFLFACFLRYSIGTRLWIALVAALLLSIARPVGIFVVLIPVIWWILGIRRLFSTFCIFVFLTGFILYFVIMWYSLGSPFAGWAAQKFHVNKPSLIYVLDFPKFINSLFNITSFHDPQGSFLDRFIFVMAFWCVVRLWRIRPSWCMVSMLMLLVPAMTNQFLSFSRFTIVVIPLFIPMGEILIQLRWPALSALVIGSLATQFYLISRFFSFEWAT